MIFIDIEAVEPLVPATWLQDSTDALKAVMEAAIEERSKTISKYSGVWSALKEPLKQVSCAKCWYCETKDLRSDNAVDHYRPKGNVKDTKPPHDGYWWLAFTWNNYRFSCTFCNSIRNSATTSGGKQDYFPLSDESKRARLKDDDLDDELPMLIDPTVDGDHALIAFDADGKARPAATDTSTLEYERAEISIKRYHLNHPEITEARLALFVQLKKWLTEADKALDRAGKGKSDGRLTAHQRLRDLRGSVRTSAEFSSAARWFLRAMEQNSKAAAAHSVDAHALPIPPRRTPHRRGLTGSRRLNEFPASGLQENDMRLLLLVAIAAMTTVTSAGVSSRTQSPQGQPAPASPPVMGGTRSGGIPVPTITLGPGLTPVPDYNKVTPPDPAPQIPEGFVPLFNGKDLSGWHVSQTARHGRTPDFRVVHGVLVGTQRPYGQGGMLVTDKKYRNFELTLEAKPDWGCDSGIFFRATESGAAYQITMDYLGTGNGSLGRLIGEGGISLGGRRGGGAGRGTAPPADPNAGRGAAAGGAQGAPSAASQAWKREDWNLIRVRVEGVAPKVTVWINNQLVTEQQDSENHAPDGMVEGPIVLQIHGGTERWAPGGFWRWRNIGIRELGN